MKLKDTNWLRFNKYLYKYWQLEAAVIILGLIATPLSLLNPFLTKLVIDKAYAHKDLKLFLILAIIGASLFIFNGLMNSLGSYLSQRISRGVNFDMTKDIFRHLQSLPLAFFNNESTSDHIYTISSDVNSVSGFVCNTIPQIVTLLPRFLFTLIIIFYLNWRLALLAFILVPVSHIRAYFFGRWLKEMTRLLIEKSRVFF